jgi:hypothetical protein
MAKTEFHAEQTASATPFSVIPSDFITMGRKHIHAVAKAHSELVDRFQEANRSWLKYIQSEADLSAEFTSKMIPARSRALRLSFWNGPPDYGNSNGRRQACPG